MMRADLVPEWMAALDLKPGDRVLEVGCGPGYVSLILADRVGPQGIVYAVDFSTEALAYLERLQNQQGISQIRRLSADAASLDGSDIRPDSALIAMVLHHADDPAGILRNVYRLMPPERPIVVAEFHPEGPCEHGPPREARLAPEQIRAWCEAAGFHVQDCRRQTAEHYMFVAQSVG
jgi:ubiquinone/menaquinone biosynthesis C-methylase UbiE